MLALDAPPLLEPLIERTFRPVTHADPGRISGEIFQIFFARLRRPSATWDREPKNRDRVGYVCATALWRSAWPAANGSGYSSE